MQLRHLSGSIKEKRMDVGIHATMAWPFIDSQINVFWLGVFFVAWLVGRALTGGRRGGMH
jgi:hypothetical protein